MIAGIRQKAIVGAFGKVEITAPDIPVGTLVDVIVLVEPGEQDTTEYLLSSESNRNHLMRALREMDDRSSYIYITTTRLEES
jgi:antitoxin YefM